MRPHRFVDLTLSLSIAGLDTHLCVIVREQTIQVGKLCSNSFFLLRVSKRKRRPRDVLSPRYQPARFAGWLTDQIRSLNETTELCRGLLVDHA